MTFEPIMVLVDRDVCLRYNRYGKRGVRTMEDLLRRRLEDVRGRIRDAARRAGRSADDIRLIVVTKTVGVDVIRALLRCGVGDIGENYVQQAMAKKESLRDVADKVRWHMIGHLQRNKAKKAVQLFDCVHSVDSVRLADELGKRSLAAGKVMPVFVEVKTSEEATKFGISEEEAPRLVEHILGVKGLRFEGLMTMAPFFEDSEKARPYFARLRELSERLRREFGVVCRLSMGMTADYEVAVEEGATDVRIGTAIVGGL